MLSARTQLGFTLIEVMTALTILAILIVLGVPSLSTYLQGAKLAGAASTYKGAVQLARTEAIRRNMPVQFMLTNSSVDTSNNNNPAANAVPSTNGTNYLVRVGNLVVNPTAYETIDVKAGAEGSASTTNSIVTASTGNGTVTFNGFGAPADGNPFRIDLSNPSAGLCVAGGGAIRCPSIIVSVAGKISNCDPAAPAGDSRACPP